MKKHVAAVRLIVFVLLCQCWRLDAQDKTGNAGSSDLTPSTTSHRDRAIQPYRLDFSFNELENGKKINTRHYSITLTEGSANEIKIGTRVPVSGDATSVPPQYQFLDLGTNIWALLRDKVENQQLDGLQLEVRSDISSTKHEDVDVSPRTPHTSFTPPIISQIKITGSTQLVLNKPMTIGIVEDPYSNRQFELEVTATKLR